MSFKNNYRVRKRESESVATLLIDGRVIAAYSRGQIVLPKSNMLMRRGEAEAI
jgi:hypothetical protein